MFFIQDSWFKPPTCKEVSFPYNIISNPTSEVYKLYFLYKYLVYRWSYKHIVGLELGQTFGWLLLEGTLGQKWGGSIMILVKLTLTGSRETGWLVRFNGRTVVLDGLTPVQWRSSSIQLTGLERPPVDIPTGWTGWFGSVFKTLLFYAYQHSFGTFYHNCWRTTFVSSIQLLFQSYLLKGALRHAKAQGAMTP